MCIYGFMLLALYVRILLIAFLNFRCGMGGALNPVGALPPVKLNDGGVLGSNVGVLLGGLKLNPVDGAAAGAAPKLKPPVDEAGVAVVPKLNPVLAGAAENDEDA